MPPGTYDVELAREDGRTWHETLIVARDVIAQAYKAPWRD